MDYVYKDRQASYNSFGQVGLIQTPSAESKSEGSVYLSINKNDTVRVPIFQISFLLKVKETVPSFLESAVGVCINPTCPNELYEEPKP